MTTYKGHLVNMIHQSRSIEDKQERINLLENMSPKQAKTLEAILLREKKKLQTIQDRYDRQAQKAINKAVENIAPKFTESISKIKEYEEAKKKRNQFRREADDLELIRHNRKQPRAKKLYRQLFTS